MKKRIWTFRASTAALAASVVLASASTTAFAQQYGHDDGQLAGAPRSQSQPQYQPSPAPPLFSGQRDDSNNDRDWNNGNDRDRDDWRNNNRKPDFQDVQEKCSKAGIQEAWRRNYYSAQYNNGPRLVETRRGWEMRGQMRLHDRKGYHYTDTACLVRGGNVDFEFLR
jgi:hypothetical protein